MGRENYPGRPVRVPRKGIELVMGWVIPRPENVNLNLLRLSWNLDQNSKDLRGCYRFEPGLVSFCFVLLDLNSKWIFLAFSLEKDKMARNTKPHEVGKIMTHT